MHDANIHRRHPTLSDVARLLDDAATMVGHMFGPGPPSRMRYERTWPARCSVLNEPLCPVMTTASPNLRLI
jgi:hypothetical protein